jgi:hypothetical protein
MPTWDGSTVFVIQRHLFRFRPGCPGSRGDENRAKKCSTHTLSFSFIKKTLDTLDVLDEALTIKPFAPSPPWPDPGPCWSLLLLPEVFRRQAKKLGKMPAALLQLREDPMPNALTIGAI